MEITIVIIVCFVLLCIIPNIGTRQPRGYQPTRRIEHPLPPRGGCATSLPISPYTGQPYDPAWSTRHESRLAQYDHIDEEAIRRIVREELDKNQDNSSTRIDFDHRLINKSDY